MASVVYVYKPGDYGKSCNLCFHRFLWVLAISGFAGLISISCLYVYDSTPESNHCIPSITPFYSQFTCTGRFENKPQEFYCGDADLFQHFPSKNANNEDCGSVIPACVACSIENVPLAQAFLCHAAIPGCAPVLGGLVSRQALSFQVENNSACFVDSGRYQTCTLGLNDSRHAYFPAFLAIALLCIVIPGFILTLQWSRCFSRRCVKFFRYYDDKQIKEHAIKKCGQWVWNDDNYDLGCERDCGNCIRRCPWLFRCCLSWSFKSLCKSLLACLCCRACYCSCGFKPVPPPGGK